MRCAIEGCDMLPLPCYGAQLCIGHGNEAVRIRDATHLPSSEWPKIVEAVRQWIETQNRKAKVA